MLFKIVVALLIASGCSIKDTDFYKSNGFITTKFYKDVEIRLASKNQYKDVDEVVRTNLRWSSLDQYSGNKHPKVIRKNSTQV